MIDLDRTIVGIDVGGANLKFARSGHSDSTRLASHSCSFAIWRCPDELATALAATLKQFAPFDALAVTMTAELADCFRDRHVGVEHIIRHTLQAAETLDVVDVSFYGVDGRFYGAAEALTATDRIAAANWHASASWLARELSEDGLLVDIGSTTTDIVPMADGIVTTSAKTDFDRLREGSLVYVGCERTPVCALVDRLTFRGESVPVMNELFATVFDARTVIGRAEQCADDTDTADGQPRTKAMSANRLARMIGLDHRGITTQDAIDLAEQVTLAASRRIDAALNLVWDSRSKVIVGGHGGDLLSLPRGYEPLDLREIVGPEVSRCLPAYAVANLRFQCGQASDR